MKNWDAENQQMIFSFMSEQMRKRRIRDTLGMKKQVVVRGVSSMSGFFSNQARKTAEKDGKDLLFPTFDGYGTQVPAKNLPHETIVRLIKSYSSTNETNQKRISVLVDALMESSTSGN